MSKSQEKSIGKEGTGVCGDKQTSRTYIYSTLYSTKYIEHWRVERMGKDVIQYKEEPDWTQYKTVYSGVCSSCPFTPSCRYCTHWSFDFLKGTHVRMIEKCTQI